ncbi:unnamed protein product [Choristocarpus tenellus]
MEGLTSIAIAEGEAARDALPGRVHTMNSILAKDFQYNSVQMYEKQFSDDLAASQGVATENVPLNKLLSAVRDETAEALKILKSLMTWISLKVPKIEDGNNFGVAVQGDVLKVVSEQYDDLLKDMRALPEYHEKRAGAWSKIAKTTSKETKTSKSSSSEKGGKDGDVSKQSSSTSEEESSKSASYSPDYALQIVDIDTNEYISLHHSLLKARNGLLIAGDMVEKNIEKIMHPKGTNTSRGSGMYAF